MRRTGISFYVDPNLYDRFRTRCEEKLCKVSQVVEGYMRWELGEEVNLRTSRELSLRLMVKADESKDRPLPLLEAGMLAAALKDDRNTREGIERCVELQLAAFMYSALVELEGMVAHLRNPEANVRLWRWFTKRDYLTAFWHIFGLALRDLTLELLEAPEKALPAVQALKDKAKENLEAIMNATQIG